VSLLVRDGEPELRSFTDSLRAFCAGRTDIVKRSRTELEFPRPLWLGLAELGVLGLGAADSGGAVWMAAAMEELGSALCPGPLPATMMIAPLLGREDAAAVSSGGAVASVGMDGTYPWGMPATLLVTMRGDEAWQVDAAAPRTAVHTLGREPWARIDAEPFARLENGCAAASLGDLAVAAYLLGVATRLVSMGADHARVREQFGKPIGSFQAVAFPLAACWAALHAAGALVRAAAESLDSDTAARTQAAAARTVVDAVATRTARVVHQVHGGSGFAEESPVAAYSARIRQWSLLPPGDEARRGALLRSIDAEEQPNVSLPGGDHT
jgi:alkylation response protein AidB-like acyl-CoA dehydrogenase